MSYETPQEEFWAGKFGDTYTDRNASMQMEASSISMFAQIIQYTNGIHSAIEFGSNRGINLKALRHLIPDIRLQAVEINQKAADECAKIGDVNVFCGSVFNYPPDMSFDLSFTRGVLIHISPEKLNDMYDILYKSSKKYILIAEYYNPTPMVVSYRGNKERLFKRDFAGEILDKYEDLSLLRYGFCYHRDNNYPTDDITWFLLEKSRK